MRGEKKDKEYQQVKRSLEWVFCLSKCPTMCEGKILLDIMCLGGGMLKKFCIMDG